MQKEYRRSCGMDVHKDTVVVCILPPVGTEDRPFARLTGPSGTI